MNVASQSVSGSSGVDSRVVAAMDEYFAAAEAGARPAREEFVARFPEVAKELAKCLEGLELIGAVGDFGELPLLGEACERRTSGIQGAALGDYRLLRELGRGGMGVVYEAVQLSLGRRVALKVLPLAAVMDPRALARFKNEALAAAALDHPHIVDVYGVGCERGVHFYAMRLIEGQTLAETIEGLRNSERDGADVERAPTLARAGEVTSPSPDSLSCRPLRGRDFHRFAAQLGVEVAEALDHAHQQGVVHRDVKPSNLMLDARGKVWITDFGLARVETAGTLTMSGDLLGTLR